MMCGRGGHAVLGELALVLVVLAKGTEATVLCLLLGMLELEVGGPHPALPELDALPAGRSVSSRVAQCRRVVRCSSSLAGSWAAAAATAASSWARADEIKGSTVVMIDWAWVWAWACKPDRSRKH